MSNLLTRALSGIVFIGVFISAILISEKTYLLLILLFGFLAIWEFCKMIKLPNKIPFIIFPFILFYFVRLASQKQLFWFLLFTLLCSVYLIYVSFFIKKKYPTAFYEKLDVSIRYIIFPFSFLAVLPFINGIYHPYLIIHLLILIWVNDSFAYLVGKNFGKHKLLPSISPKKTVEGLFGGIIFSLIAAVIISKYNHTFTLINWLIISFILSNLGTIGDLIESKFKRQANIKDSSNIMPGHGGILDRLDSLFFAAPFVYLYIHFIL